MTACKNGHQRTDENTRYDRDGYPVCRECHRETRRRERARGYTAGAKDRSAELARDLYGLADLIREQHLGWEATYDNIRRAADHYRKEGTQ